MIKPEVQLQREYYTRTAKEYEALHMRGDGEHDMACALIQSLAGYHRYSSILDVGSGTGRAIMVLSKGIPHVRVVGVEPVDALRAIGYSHGINPDNLVDGDATKLQFNDGEFDLVCELGVLHHIPNPRQAISEMIRVSGRAIFISDCNRFGRGSRVGRLSKVILWRLGVWPVMNWIKTRGRGYDYLENDGIAYSYSIFDDYDFIRRQFDHVMVFNLDGDGKSPLTGAAHVGLFAFNKKSMG